MSQIYNNGYSSNIIQNNTLTTDNVNINTVAAMLSGDNVTCELKENQQKNSSLLDQPVSSLDISASKQSASEATDKMNIIINSKLENVKSAICTLSSHNLDGLDQGYAEASQEDRVKLDNNMAEIFSDALAPKNNFQKLVNKINEQIVSKIKESEAEQLQQAITETFNAKLENIEKCLVIGDSKERAHKLDRALEDFTKVTEAMVKGLSIEANVSEDIQSEVLKDLESIKKATTVYISGESSEQQVKHDTSKFEALAPKSNLEKLVSKINEQVISKFKDGDANENQEVFSEIFNSKINGLKECLAIKNPEEKALKLEQALDDFTHVMEALVKGICEDSNISSKVQGEILKDLESIKNVAKPHLYLDIPSQQVEYNGVKEIISNIINASELGEATNAQSQLKDLYQKMGGKELDEGVKVRFKALDDLIGNKIERLNKISERQVSLNEAISSKENIKLFYKLNSEDFKPQEGSFVGKAGQSAIDQQETDLIKSIRELQGNNAHLQVILGLRAKLPESLLDSFDILLEKIKYGEVLCNKFAKLSSEEFTTLLSGMEKALKNPSLENCDEAFKAINTLFMNKSEKFDASFAKIIKKSLIPSNKDRVEISSYMKMQHLGLLTCNKINTFLANHLSTVNDGISNQSSRVLDIADMTSGKLLAMLSNKGALPTTMKQESIDVLVLSGAYQLAKAEKLVKRETFNIEEDFYKGLSGDMKELAKSYVENASHLNFMTREQLNRFKVAFNVAQKITGLGSFRRLLKQMADDPAKVENAIKRLARHVGINPLDSEDKVKDINDIIKECSALFSENIRKLDPTISNSARVQMKNINELNKAFENQHPIAKEILKRQNKGKPNSTDIHGETLAASLLTIQRVLIRKLDDLSEYDLNLIGMTPDDLKDQEKRQEIIAQRVDAIFGKTNREKTPEEKERDADKLTLAEWQKSVLLSEYIDTVKTNDKYSEYVEKGTINNEIITMVASIRQQNLLENFTGSLDEDKSQDDGTKMLKALNIVTDKALINLSEARSHVISGNKSITEVVKGKSDRAGDFLQKLLTSYTSKNGLPEEKDNESFTVNGVLFAYSPKDTMGFGDRKTIRQAIIDILNGKEIKTFEIAKDKKGKTIMVDDKPKVDVVAVKYLPPIDAAHSILALQYDMSKPANSARNLDSRSNHVDFIEKKAFKKEKLDAMGEKREFSKYLRLDLLTDLQVKVGHGEIFKFLTDTAKENYEATLKSVLNNTEFKEKTLPLAILSAFSKAKSTSIVDFTNDIEGNASYIIDAFKEQGFKSEVAEALCTLLELNSKEDKSKAVLRLDKVFEKSLSKYAFTSIGESVAIAFGHDIHQTKNSDELRQDSLTAIRGIPKGNTLNFSDSIQANIALTPKTSPVDASFSFGKGDGMMLSRNNDGTMSLRISNSLFVKGSIGASLEKVAKLELSGSTEGEQFLTFNFKTDAKCASFMGEFLAGKSSMESLKYCSSVATGHGVNLSGKIEVGIGGKIEKKDCFTLSFGVLANIEGDWAYNTNELAEETIVTTEKSYSMGIAVEVELGLQDELTGKLQAVMDVKEKIDEVTENVKNANDVASFNNAMESGKKLKESTRELKDKIKGVKDDDDEDEESLLDNMSVSNERGFSKEAEFTVGGVTLKAQANFNLKTSNQAGRSNINGNITSLSNTTSTDIGGSSPAISAKYFAKELGFDSETANKLYEKIDGLDLESFNLAFTRSMSPAKLAILNSLEDEQAKQTFMNDSHNFDEISVRVTFSEGMSLSDSYNYLGVVELKSKIEGSSTVELFKVA